MAKQFSDLMTLRNGGFWSLELIFVLFDVPTDESPELVLEEASPDGVGGGSSDVYTDVISSCLAAGAAAETHLGAAPQPPPTPSTPPPPPARTTADDVGSKNSVLE